MSTIPTRGHVSIILGRYLFYMMNENLIRITIRRILAEVALIPKALTDKTGLEFLIGPKGKAYLEELGFGTTPRHRVRIKDPETEKYITATLSDVDLIANKLTTLDLSQFYKYDESFRRYSTPLVPASLLKAMSIEETLIGSDLDQNVSSAEGVLQVIGGTLDLLNVRRGWLGKPPYTVADVTSSPEKSIQIAAEYINNHMIAPKNEFKGKDGIARNKGGFGYTIDQMLEKYKTGDDAARYRERVKVYKKLIDDLGGV